MRRLFLRILLVVALVVLTAGVFSAEASRRCPSCPRDARGRIARDSKAVREFKRANPKPPGCRRCEVDHIVPLHRGGADHPSNMQWLPRDVHRDKTRREAR
jgi:hypothetical protein